MIVAVGYPGMSRVLCALTTCYLLLCLASRATGEYEPREVSSGGPDDRASGNGFGSCTDGKCMKRTTQEITSGMWFGPRLGRRRRSDEKSEMSPDAAFEALVNALNAANDKRQPQFTPRLGRGFGEELLTYGNAIDGASDEDENRPLPPLFASRLGRRRLPWTPSPRLGRQLRSALQKL